ncbi:DNA cytosine methyltransferase [Desulfosporosinus nitroreducens]|uniref:DNA cytosine methyltransferase n=1 Tax=Desulfosporosinus nitroreducens TaxID=2018668 RepID=UPI00207D5B9D|nr:DNA cytosine methyltransferase [Desulfosporosinus nitroreducens]MCO1599859.1 DNA cytosine methyltransferase [Desulfosporosinus nitroreducens]
MTREIIVDNFAGGGGASTGIALAIGRSVDIAINHDPEAIAMHKVNHPDTDHYCESVWEVDPRKAANGRPVGLVWLSPDCKHFSKAKGGKPVAKNIRGLAWVAVRWAATVRPRVIMLENVEEFKTWGPLLKNGMPDTKQKGRTFNAFVNALKRQGYQVQYRELRACDYGAPTIRKRFFLIARCDGLPITWPKPTHGDPSGHEVKAGILKPWRTAAEIVDWTKPCPSIFDTTKEIKDKYGVKAVRPLADNTMKRIAKGTDKFVINNPQPFIMSIGQTGFTDDRVRSIHQPLNTIVTKAEACLITPTLMQYHSYESDGVRGQTIDRPILTIDTNPRYALTAVFVSKYYGTGEGSNLKDPLHTVTTKDRNALIETHLCILRNHMDCKELKEPLPTITTSPGHFAEIKTVLTKIDSDQDLGRWPEVREMLNKYCGYNIASDEILLLKINGELYFISDIGMRMLEPRELFNAQSFSPDYIIDRDINGKKLSKATQVAKCGNSVPPVWPDALVRANLPELCGDIAPSQMEIFN